MKHRLSINFGPLWAFVLIFALSTSLAFTSVVRITRAQQTAYACLRMTGASPGADVLIDTRTGLIARDARPLTFEHPIPTFGHWRSPDGQWIAYTRTDASLTRRDTLYVQPAEQPIDPATARKLGENMGITAVAWSPTSEYLLYVYRAGGGDLWVTLYKVADDTARNQIIATALRREATFYGWSADGALFALGTEDSFGRAVTYWSVKTFKAEAFPQFGLLNFIENTTWSPTKQRFAYVRSDLGTRARLVIAALDVADPTRRGENSLEIPYQQNMRLTWSPDGEHLAVTYEDQQGWQLVIYRPGVVEPEEVFSTRMGGRSHWPRSVAWTADGQALAFWQTAPSTARDLAVYRLASGQVETVAQNLDFNRDPFEGRNGAAFGGGRIALAYRTVGGALAVDLMEVDGGRRQPLIRGASEVDSAVWSPDRRTALIGWATVEGARRVTRLTVIREGANPATEVIDMGGGLPVNVRWLANGWVVYALFSPSEATRIETLNPVTGERRVLATTRWEMLAIEPVANGEGILYWGQTGEQSYTLAQAGLDGKHQFQFAYESDVPGDISALSGQVFPAPDNQQAVLFHSIPSIPYLLGPEGRFVRLTTDARAPMRAVWSPDGNRIALVYLDSGPTLEVRIFDGRGQWLRTFEAVESFNDNVFWTRCD